MTIYKIIVDYGKPYEITCINKEELFKELKKLEEMNKKDYAYFDVFIYDEDNKDITENILKQFERGF